MTELVVQIRDIDTVLPYEKNAKKHPATQIGQIAKSISNFGFNIPILVDKANVIVTGHARYLAAQKLNLKQVPVAVLEKLTPEQIKKFRLADNKGNKDPDHVPATKEDHDIKQGGLFSRALL